MRTPARTPAEALTVAGASVADTALTLGNRVGRYFSLVSMLPALLLVLWSYILLASGAWSGPPEVGTLVQKLSQWSLGDAAWALLITLVVALFLHPL